MTMTPKCKCVLLLQHLLLVSQFLLRFSTTAAIITVSSESQPQYTITSLPGFPGPLAFKLETGYIGVGEDEQVQLFYYFIESQGDPVSDPLLFWLNGGPGCSGFSGLVYEIGPLQFDTSTIDGSFPSFITNPYSWTKAASIIFIDSPVGTGFSYATTQQGYYTSDTKAAQDNYMFFRKWMLSHPKFMKNFIYVAGDSYGGIFAPMVALAIAQGNEAGLEPRILLQGYIIGNPRTDANEDNNEKIPYAHRMALISDEYFELAKRSCDGNYVNPNPENIQCIYALHLVDECIKLIYSDHILEPTCGYLASTRNDGFQLRDSSLVEDDPTDDFISLLSSREKLPCRNLNYVLSHIWMNNETTQEALHIKKGSIREWRRCNRSRLAYEHDVESVLEYHRVLISEKGFRALVYSGDHDLGIPYMSTLKWIHKLNLTVYDDWRPWTVDGQVAGYTMTYIKNEALLTFATVKGAGHTAPEYKPKECLQMLQRWLSLYPL